MQLLMDFGWRFAEVCPSFSFVDKEDPVLWQGPVIFHPLWTLQVALVHQRKKKTFRSSQRAWKHCHKKAAGDSKPHGFLAAGQLHCIQQKQL